MMTLRIAMAALMVIAIPSITEAQTNPAAPKPPTAAPPIQAYKPTPMIHSAIPAEVGCHVETAPGKLTKVPCLSPQEIAKLPHPTACTGADGDAACGMESSGPAGKDPPPLTEAFLQVTLQQYSSSTDTKFGAGAYSLQLNTNAFKAPNTTGWVQFAFQSSPTGGTRFCVWNIDWTHSKYDPVCTGTNPIPLTAKVRFVVGGFVCADGCTYVPNPPVIYGWLHWETLNANGTVCSGCSNGTIWASAPDTYGLAKGWLQVSGSILGLGNSSKINFQPYAVDQNVLGATSCPIPLAPGWVCKSPRLDGQYAVHAGWVTAEANNLYYAPNPNWVVPPVPQSAMNCSDGFCWLTAYEIYPEK
jgi:hypothetical protein